jgi:hypothetical protein
MHGDDSQCRYLTVPGAYAAAKYETYVAGSNFGHSAVGECRPCGTCGNLNAPDPALTCWARKAFRPCGAGSVEMQADWLGPMYDFQF